jgi:hypothetical protein
MIAYQTPWTTSLAAPLGPLVFRKHALSFGRWQTPDGRTLIVDRPYLERVAANFRAGALDQVPFQLADDSNRHTDDPERYRGQIKGVEIGSDGLYVTAEMTEAGAQLVQANPNLGVSVRLLSESKRGDGKAYTDVLGHVLGTLRPQVPGLKPWEAVQMAAGDGIDVVDLTAAHDASATMSFTDEQKTEITALITSVLAEANKPGGTAAGTPPESAEMSAVELQALADTARLAELAAAEKPAPVELSADAQARITAAEKAAADAQAEAQTVTASATWAKTRVDLANAGVPPALLDVAEPVLSKPPPANAPTFDFAAADGKTVKLTERDALLRLLEQNKGRVQVNREAGSSEFAAAGDDQAAHDAALAQLRAADGHGRVNGGADVTKIVTAVTAALKAIG